MGAGNPLIRSYDEEKYSPKTYYIDFTESIGDKDEVLKEHYEANDLDIESVSDNDKDDTFNQLVDWNIQSFMEDYFFQEDQGFHEPDETHIEELSAEFRGSGVILAETDDCLVVHAGGEPWHFSIGMVPNFKLEDIWDEMYDENRDKEEWYDARNKSFSTRIDTLADKEYDKRLKKWLKEYEPCMRLLHKHYGKHMSGRSGAWTSCSLKTIGENFEFL